MTIDDLIRQTKSRTKRLQDILFLKVLDYVVREIYVKDDTIVFNQSNIAAINRIDKIIEKDKGFSKELKRLKSYVLGGIKKLLQDVYIDQSREDIRAIEIGSEVNDRIIKHAVRTIDQMTNLTPIYEDVKKQAIALMSKYEGISLLELRNQLSTQIEEKNIVNKYWSRWTYDIYSQYERIGANEVRKRLGFAFAIYEGGEIETTREFCSERNRKVFHESEIQKWIDLEWEGKNQIGYNPFIDLGGYNCRHKLRWISRELAEMKRPEVVVLFPMEFIN